MSSGESVQSAHLVGVCGAGMKALAELLMEQGCRLSSSDLAPMTPAVQSLVAAGMVFHQGHDVTHLPQQVQCLVFSPAIPTTNPERMEASRRGIPQWTYSQMVGRLMQSRIGVCIAGTHGKSTTTAMVAWILAAAGRAPSFLIGAEFSKGWNSSNGPSLRSEFSGELALADRLFLRSGVCGSGELIVVESCEFERSFLDFTPQHAAILSIEPDHFDCFGDMESLQAAFVEFAQKLPPDGTLVLGGDCSNVLNVAAKVSTRITTFGIGSENDWRPENIEHLEAGVSFRIRRKSRLGEAIQLSLHGEHNVLNALAAAAICWNVGLSEEEVAAGLRSFPGIRRRFEVVSEKGGITTISDYAHHPTAVRESLKTARRTYAGRRIVCVFQPHQISRTLALMDDFSLAFDDADDVIIAPVFAARERVTTEPILVGNELVGRIAARFESRLATESGRRRTCCFGESLDRIRATLDDATSPGDVLVVMGAGDVDCLCSVDHFVANGTFDP